jgi:RHS repeat-associated protein
VRERDGTGAPLRDYLYGTDLVSMTAAGDPFYYHHDSIGSVTNLTSQAGDAQWTYTYEPYGAARSTVQDDLGAPENLIRFTGELLDPATNLYHLRARQYDPASGRFLATDPVAPAVTDPYVSTYVYVNNRPTVLIDPAGTFGVPGWGRVKSAASAAVNFVDANRELIAVGAIGTCAVVTVGQCLWVGVAAASLDTALNARALHDGRMDGQHFFLRTAIDYGTLGLASKFPALAALAGRRDIAVTTTLGLHFSWRFRTSYEALFGGLGILQGIAATAK